MESMREYLETQVLTATPYRLHLMVVDGALRFARTGLSAMESGDWETLDLALSRSRDCVSELLSGLRSETPSDLVDSVKSLFAFVYRSLALADPERNPQRIADAIRVLEMHRETWIELGEQLGRPTDENIPAPHARSWTT